MPKPLKPVPKVENIYYSTEELNKLQAKELIKRTRQKAYKCSHVLVLGYDEDTKQFFLDFSEDDVIVNRGVLVEALRRL